MAMSPVILKTKWDGQADGPYVHLDSFLEYLAAVAAALTEPEARVAVALVERMITALTEFKGEAVRERLDQIVANVDVPSLTNDLLALRDELAADDG